MLKYKKTNKQHSKTFGDVTINDFANAVICSNRPRKSTNDVKQECEKAWHEIADDENFDYVREMNEDGTYVLVLRKQSQQVTKSDKEPVDNVQISNSYPLDIWYLISEHIRPQDVGKFAGICKASYAVICSAKFWFTLYKRFYKYSPSLPLHLQRDHMVRLYGLRTSVIRALYFMYLPFVNRLKSIRQCTRHPATLVKKQCVSAFYKQGLEPLYCFKFKEYMPSSLKQVPCKQNVIDVLEDITANPDENCYMLLFSARCFLPIPCVEGLILKSALLTLSQGFCYQRLQLEFSSQMYNSGRTSGGSDHTSVVFDLVTGVKVLDWWDPQYPYNYDLKYLLVDKEEEEENEPSNFESLLSMI